MELAALRSYCDLNQTGFYKIIKKYDKTMEVCTVHAADKFYFDIIIMCFALVYSAKALEVDF